MQINQTNRYGKLAHFSTRHLTIMALLLAMRILLSYLPGINIGKFVEMGFGFIGTTTAAAILGPFYMVIFAVFYDLLDILVIHPTAMFFIGFTLSAAVAGFIYAKGLWRQEVTAKRAIIVTFIVTLGVNLIMNTFWIQLMYDKAWIGLIQLRLIKNLISFPLNAFIIYMMFNYPPFKRLIKKYQF